MVRSIIKSVWLIVAQAARAAGALARGNAEAAGGHLRFLYQNLYEDLAQTLVAVQRRLPLWRAPGPDIDRILVVKLDRIGDMVNTTPALDALRERFPLAKIDVVGHPVALSLLDGDPRVNERIPYVSWLYHPGRPAPPGLRAWRLIFRLIRRRYPLVVCLRGSAPFLLLGLRSRLAAAKFVAAEPVIDRYLNALRTLGGPVTRSTPRLLVVPAVRDEVERLFLPREGRRTTRVAIQATSVSETREWPRERFAEVADRLHRDFGAEVHFFGSEDERNKLNEIARSANQTHAFHIGLRLPEVVAAISACDLFIGNDSGLSHIAGAVGLPLIVIWGAANLNMSRPNVPADRLTILYHELPCRCMCPEFFCVNPVSMQCLKEISVAEVMGAVAKLLQSGGERVALPLAPAAG